MTELKQTLTTEEQELIQNPIGRWGEAWQKFMKENCTPDEISANFKDNDLGAAPQTVRPEKSPTNYFQRNRIVGENAFSHG